MYEGEMRKPFGCRYPVHVTWNNINPQFRNSVEAKKNLLLCYGILLFMLTFVQFSWVAAIFLDNVFERFWVGQKKKGWRNTGLRHRQTFYRNQTSSLAQQRFDSGNRAGALDTVFRLYDQSKFELHEKRFFSVCTLATYTLSTCPVLASFRPISWF